MARFIEGEMETEIDYEINSRILEQASEVAEVLTELDCKLNNIECYVVEIENGTEIQSYTEEAQDIFNSYYDEQVTKLYNLLNRQLEIIEADL